MHIYSGDQLFQSSSINPKFLKVYFQSLKVFLKIIVADTAKKKSLEG